MFIKPENNIIFIISNRCWDNLFRAVCNNKNYTFFNKNVITDSFNDVVLQELSKYIDPEGEEKTIIFAVNDQHAETIVKKLRKIYEEQDILGKVVEKITCAIVG